MTTTYRACCWVSDDKQAEVRLTSQADAALSDADLLAAAKREAAATGLDPAGGAFVIGEYIDVHATTAAARALRAIPSEARTEASRANGRRGGRPPMRHVVLDDDWRVVSRHQTPDAASAAREAALRSPGRYRTATVSRPVRAGQTVARADIASYGEGWSVGEDCE